MATDPTSTALRTLAYADVFDYCLSNQELVRLAIEQPLRPSQLRQIRSPWIKQTDGLWHLKGSSELARARVDQRTIQQQKITRAKQRLWVFRFVPWVQLVAVTGSVAGGNPKNSDDIDLLVITQINRLWLSRLIIVVALSALRARRRPGQPADQVTDLLCLNMWLSEESLEETSKTLYEANELARVIPLLNRHQAHQRYLQSNGWLKRYLPNVKLPVVDAEPGANPWPILGNLASVLDLLSRRVLLKIMRPPTQETISETVLKFHPRNYRQQVLAAYKRRLSAIMAS